MNNKLDVFSKFTLFGVVGRDQVKNDLPVVQALVRDGVVRKAYKKGRVFYELTGQAVSLLEEYRHKLLAEVRLSSQLYPRRHSFYTALLEDVRFLDTSSPDARSFQFLGDWRLKETPLVSQLQLSQRRFYEKMGLA